MGRRMTMAAGSAMGLAMGLAMFTGGAFAQDSAAPEPAETAPEAAADLAPIPTPPPAPIADGEQFPAGMAVLERGVAARGGLEAWKKLKNVRLKGTFEMTMMGLSGPLTISLQNPDAMHVLVELPAVGGEVVQAAKGNKVWMMQPPMTEPQLIEGEDSQAMAEQSDFLAAFEPRRVLESATVTAVEDVRGEQAYRVEITTKSGQKRAEWYGVESGLKLREVGYDENGLPAQESFFSDYRRAGDLMHAMKTELVGAMGSRSLIYTTVEYDVDLDKALFIPPGEL